MRRAKLFAENFFAYGFTSALSKVIPFLLLPVITRMLPDPSDYGIYDMYNTIVGFGSPLVMLGMYDALFREYFEKDDQQYRDNLTITAKRIVFIASLITCLALILFNKPFSKLLYGTSVYGIIVVFSAVELMISSNSSIIATPTRIKNDKKIYIASGLINSLLYYLLALLLIYFGFSYYGLIYANITSTILLLIFFWNINSKYFRFGLFDKSVAKELLKIGLPLVPTFLIYWVYNSMDKVMIANILGAKELGIYSIGAKIASISTLIYYAFAGGWQYFAFSTMKDKDQVQLTTKVFEYLALISFSSFIIGYPFIKGAFGLLFEGQYLNGYIIVPYLYLGPLLLMLFQVAGNQFVVVKKTYLPTIALSIGALINVVLNVFFIPKLGVEGAAIATLVGYATSVAMVCILTATKKLFKINIGVTLISSITVIYIIFCRFYLLDRTLYQIFTSFIVLAVFGLIYRVEVKLLLKQIWKLKMGKA